MSLPYHIHDAYLGQLTSREPRLLIIHKPLTNVLKVELYIPGKGQ